MACRLAIGRGESTGVAACTLVYCGHLRVVPLARLPSCSSGAVAGFAIERRRHMTHVLARCCTSVMASDAIGRRIEQAVIGLDAKPDRSRNVATFTITRHRGMHAIGGLASHAIAIGIAEVAGRTLRCNRYIGMQTARTP